MNDESAPEPEKRSTHLASQVGAMATRKLKARRSEPSVWFGLGMMGMIGWSVAMPTTVGAALGLWLDRHYPASHSWTLTLLVSGLVLGCVNAWRWISSEERAMRRQQEESDE